MSEMASIKLTELIEKGTPRPIISGRDVGRNFRTKLGDHFFEENPYIELEVPNHTKLITPSVFLGLFGHEMKQLSSVEEIERHYRLIGANKVTVDNFLTAARASIAKML